MTFGRHGEEPLHSPEKLLHSPDETAALLGIGPTRVFDLLARGEIESFKIGRLRKIPHEAVVDYIERQRAAARTPQSA